MLVARPKVPTATKIRTHCNLPVWHHVFWYVVTNVPEVHTATVSVQNAEGKSKFLPVPTKHSTTNAYGGVEVKLHVFLNPYTRWRWVCNFTLRRLYSKMNFLRFTLNRRFGGLHCLFRSFREEREIWYFGRESNYGKSIISSCPTYNTEWEVQALKRHKTEQKKQTKKLVPSEPSVFIHSNK